MCKVSKYIGFLSLCRHINFLVLRLLIYRMWCKVEEADDHS